METTLPQPFLISAMVKFVEHCEDWETKNIGHGLIVAFALNYAFLPTFLSWYPQSVTRFVIKLRSCLLALIYHKTLNIASKEVNLGLVTILMNIDMEKVLLAVKNMHEFWTMTVNGGIAWYILYTHLGVAFVPPLITILIAISLSSSIGKMIKPRQTDWVAAMEKRVTSIAYTTSCMKGVRMLGLTETVLNMVTRLRKTKVAVHSYIRKLLVRVQCSQ